MQIYFGALPFNDEFMSPEGMLFSGECDTHAFYYGVEYGSNAGGTDEVLIYDGLDRSIPVDVESVPAMIKALETAYGMYKAIKAAEVITSEVEKYDSEAHVI